MTDRFADFALSGAPSGAPPSGAGVRLRPEIVSLPAYRQGRPGSVDSFKLSSNENPFPPHPAVQAAIRNLDINRYPDSTALVVRERLAERHGVTPDEVIVGAGSVALLAQLILAAATVGDEVVYSWRSFEAYPGLVTVSGATSVRVPLTASARHDLVAMAAAVTDRTRVVIVCSPNNPTGTVVTASEFTTFMESVPSSLLVILDEAYAEFVLDPLAVDGAALVRRYANLVILRTFSKAYGLAGLRVGYAIGAAEVLDAARSAAIPLAVTAAAQAAVLAALDHEVELLANVRVLAERRDVVHAALARQGWNLPAASGNFIWLPTGAATEAANDSFLAAGIVGRAFAGEGIRMSIAEEDSVASLLAIAAQVVRTL